MHSREVQRLRRELSENVAKLKELQKEDPNVPPFDNLTIRYCLFQKISLEVRKIIATGYTNIKRLFINNCDLRTFENIPDLPQLEYVNAAHNNMRGSFEFIVKNRKITFFDVSFNVIQDPARFKPLCRLNMCRVYLKGNPCVAERDGRRKSAIEIAKIMKQLGQYGAIYVEQTFQEQEKYEKMRNEREQLARNRTVQVKVEELYIPPLIEDEDDDDDLSEQSQKYMNNLRACYPNAKHEILINMLNKERERRQQIARQRLMMAQGEIYMRNRRAPQKKEIRRRQVQQVDEQAIERNNIDRSGRSRMIRILYGLKESESDSESNQHPSPEEQSEEEQERQEEEKEEIQEDEEEDEEDEEDEEEEEEEQEEEEQEEEEEEERWEEQQEQEDDQEEQFEAERFMQDSPYPNVGVMRLEPPVFSSSEDSGSFPLLIKPNHTNNSNPIPQNRQNNGNDQYFDPQNHPANHN